MKTRFNLLNKFLFTDEQLSVSEIINKDKKRRPTKRLLSKIQRSQLVRVRESVQNWRAAMSMAESVHHPDRTDLQRIFKDIALDGHLRSLMKTMVLKTTSSPFFIENEDGEINEDLTKNFKKKWFRDFIKYTIESSFYGYSLIELGDIKDNCFVKVKSIPREYVLPEKKSIKRNLRLTSSELIPFDKGGFEPWTVFVEDVDSLGVLNSAAPLVVWKRNVLSAWSEAAELFGMPIRMGKTDINNPQAYSNMKNMLENMGSAAWAVMDVDDTIEFAEATKTDFHEIYDRLIERLNSELSKLILGQTMTSDDGSSKSQAEVHNDILTDIVSACKMMVSDVVNDQLIPLMARHGMLTGNEVYKHDDEEKIGIDKRFDMVDKIQKWTGVKVVTEWIQETFGIPLEEVEPPEELTPNPLNPSRIENVTSVMPTVRELMNKCNHR